MTARRCHACNAENVPLQHRRCGECAAERWYCLACLAVAAPPAEEKHDDD